ncbi:hypothetical protein K505DRAFT_410225 [Melanomma pulvis-pyrius CBS 109.77]|uniref:Wax synthase domain-containing protein n=1 Tax=Melanomma pulvis-pyrius CBS 109.77 TaxID=1314802 RepID=A0A6A6X0C4_9PLEO|nr:hypothetical protein K505DRAFT_410225 [Melanomma pulvis-pyrius CBS 109.77]
MESSLPNIVFKKPDSSIVPHILLWLVQIIALSSPPFTGRRATFSVLIIALGVYCNVKPHFTNNFDLAQPFSIAWSFYTAVLAKLLFSGPPEDNFWRIDEPAREARAYTGFGWKRFRWTTALIFNHRGIRWNYQVKNVPLLPKTSKSRFLASQLAKSVGCFCMADLLYYIHQRVNFTTSDGRVGQLDSKYLTLRQDNWRWSVIKTFSLAGLPYFALNMQFAQGGFLSVLFGISKPEDWPPPFGSIDDMRTVRSFWGAFWHQQLRHMLSSYTDAFANILRIRRGTNLSSYAKLYLAFFISGAFHALGQLHLPRPANITAEECSMGFLHFFIWQAFAITIEDFVKWLWQIAGWSTEGVRIIGYAWVFFSMWWSFPLAGDTVLKLRIGAGSFAPFPLMKPLVNALIPLPP